MLTLSGVHTFYGNIEALKGIDLEVPAGEIVTLIGANGAGKSTLLMTICGQPRASAGSIRYEGRDIAGLATFEIMRLGIAQSPEGRRVFPRMTVEENLKLGATVADVKHYDADLARVYKLFPRLEERRNQTARTLSGGEQQMLAIGRALMTNPHLLILDEATEGLAPVVRQEIWAAIHALKAAGQAILVIDKTLKELAGVADRCFVLERGRTVWTGTTAELTPAVTDRYLGV